MVDTGEEVGFHFLTKVGELHLIFCGCSNVSGFKRESGEKLLNEVHLHARVPDVPAFDLLLKWTAVNLV